MAVTNEPALRDPSWTTPQEQYLARQRNNDQFLEIVNSLGSFSEGEFTSLEEVVTALVEQRPTLGTVQATTSGTEKDFTGIPSWVQHITVMFSGVSTNGTSEIILQIGDSGGLETSAYNGGGIKGAGASSVVAEIPFTSGFKLSGDNNAATRLHHGSVYLTLLDPDTNLWSCSGEIGASETGRIAVCAGSKALSGVLTQLRITMANGTDAFDAGSLNIRYSL